MALVALCHFCLNRGRTGPRITCKWLRVECRQCFAPREHVPKYTSSKFDDVRAEKKKTVALDVIGFLSKIARFWPLSMAKGR